MWNKGREIINKGEMEMTEKLFMTKAAISAFFAAAAAFLGWRMILLITWVVLMVLDYLSGSLAARSRGEWKSAAARQGIFHKAGMILVVLVTMIADLVILMAFRNLPYEALQIHWPVVLFPMVTVWYILTETGSIIENAIAMGARVPQWLPKLLNASTDAIDHAVTREDA